MALLRDSIALHTWTLDTTPLARALAVARAAGYNAMELRHIDFKRALAAGMSNEQVIDLIRASGMPVAVMGTEYGLIFARGGEVDRLLEALEQTCANAVALGCGTIMIAPGANPPGTIREAAANFRRGGEIAERHGLRFALEFNSRHAVINRLEVAREILAAADHPSCGLLLDAYHMHYSGCTASALEALPAHELFAFQYSDAPPGPSSGERIAVDRLPPGRGVVRWAEVFEALLKKSYSGVLSYEAPNPAQWARPADEVAREGIEATRALIREVEGAG